MLIRKNVRLGSFKVDICAGFSVVRNANVQLMPRVGINYRIAEAAEYLPPCLNKGSCDFFRQICGLLVWRGIVLSRHRTFSLKESSSKSSLLGTESMDWVKREFESGSSTH